MFEYIDGLAWAAENVSNLKFQAGHVSCYYIAASITLIGSLLAVLLPKKNS
jgi:hypothetical protein